jgi:hypothetical protein
MARYHVRLVHRIAPSLGDEIVSVELPDAAFADRSALGAALRKALLLPSFYPGLRTILGTGERIDSFRIEGNKIVAFPRGSIWHSVILTHEGNEP